MQTRLNEVMVGLAVLISKFFTFIGKNFQTIITIIGIYLTINFVQSVIKSFEKPVYTQEFVNALQDTLTVVKNKNGELTTSINVLRTDNYKDVLSIQTKDKALLRLQNELKQIKNSNTTIATVNTSINNILNVDSSKTKFQFEDKWTSLKGETYPNPYFKLVVINEPTITQYIKDSKMVAEYKDNNPYTTVKELKSYSPLPKVTIFDKIKVGPSISWTPLSGGGFQPGISVIYSIY